MKRKGFTLSELLIALSIIGIASALFAPVISDIMPDKSKSFIMKYYSNISQINSEILDNSSLYDISDTCSGLDCKGTPTNTEFASCSNQSSKYGCIVGKILGLDNYNELNGIVTGETADGTTWTIGTSGSSYTISMVLNNGGKSGKYSSSNKNPNTFIFKVDNWGDITAGDVMTYAYIKNPLNMNNKKKDRKAADDCLNGKTKNDAACDSSKI